MRRLAIAILVLTGIPLSAFAAGSASFGMRAPSGTVRAGDEFSVVLTVDANGESVDTARAFLEFSTELLSVERVSLGEVFYRVSPGNVFDNEDGTISYGAFSIGEPVTGSGTFATVVFEAKREGTAEITLLGSSRLISAGVEKGTGIPSGVTVEIGAASDAVPHTIVPDAALPDILPPNPIEPYTARERYVEGDDALLEFGTTDDGSGIDHYELSLNGGAYVSATSPYVLSDLEAGDLFIQVKAVDRAGNERFGKTEIRVYPLGTELTPDDQALAAQEAERIRELQTGSTRVDRTFASSVLFAVVVFGAILLVIRRLNRRSP